MARDVEIFVRGACTMKRLVKCLAQVIGHDFARVDSEDGELYHTSTLGFDLAVFEQEGFQDDRDMPFSSYDFVVDFRWIPGMVSNRFWPEWHFQAPTVLAEIVSRRLKCDCMVTDDLAALVATFRGVATEELLYFTRSRVTLDDIQALAGEAGFEVSRQTISGKAHLNIYFGGEYQRSRRCGKRVVTTLDRDFWQWRGWDDFASLDEPALDRVRRYTPWAAFQVSYRPPSRVALAGFLKRVLDRFDGWVGLDDDWSCTYDATNVAEFGLANED